MPEKMESEPVEIYTDGGCLPNPGTGGWGAVLIYKGRIRELSGGAHRSTNNRMELTAAIEALKVLKRRCRVRIHTDSEYLKKGITDWLSKWKRLGWKRKEGPLKNRELWRELDHLCSKHQVEWRWTPGHTGNLWNERCDLLAREAIARLRGVAR